MLAAAVHPTRGLAMPHLRLCLFALWLGLLPLLVPTACFVDDSETTDTVREAIDELVGAGVGEAATRAILDVTTSFEPGLGVPATVDAIQGLLSDEIACAAVSVDPDGATLALDFGARSDGCQHLGRNLAGLIELRVVTNQRNNIELSYAFLDFVHAETILNGELGFRWDGTPSNRELSHQLNWDSAEGTVASESQRTWKLLDPPAGIAAGIEVQGTRDWSSIRGLWHLQMDGLQVQGVDPVPQAGAGVLTTPRGNELDLSFERLDASTVRVVVLFENDRWTLELASEAPSP
jgi:hypothetical protein